MGSFAAWHSRGQTEEKKKGESDQDSLLSFFLPNVLLYLPFTPLPYSPIESWNLPLEKAHLKTGLACKSLFVVATSSVNIFARILLLLVS